MRRNCGYEEIAYVESDDSLFRTNKGHRKAKKSASKKRTGKAKRKAWVPYAEYKASQVEKKASKSKSGKARKSSGARKGSGKQPSLKAILAELETARKMMNMALGQLAKRSHAVV